MLIEIHMIKNYPPVNLNRDDTGMPKTCYFGGTQRGRISSQCLKRAWRFSEMFLENIGDIGVRTRKFPELIKKRLVEKGIEMDTAEETQRLVIELMAKKKKNSDKDSSEDDTDEGEDSDEEKTGKKKEFSKLKQMVFLNQESDVEIFADAIMHLVKGKSKKEVKKLKGKDLEKELMKNKGDVRPITIDIALFGRMVTSTVFANVEASIQVAHAISTHCVFQESDYFTAVDDLISSGESDDTGAGMVGDTDFNSCCFYHYAALDTDQLKNNLKSSPEALSAYNNIVDAFIRTIAFSNPSGKQNSFAGHMLPDVMCIEIKKKKIPVSYANAFAVPVRNGSQLRLVEESTKKLVEEINLLDNAFGVAHEKRVWFAPRFPEISPEDCVQVKTIVKLIDACQ